MAEEIQTLPTDVAASTSENLAGEATVEAVSSEVVQPVTDSNAPTEESAKPAPDTLLGSEKKIEEAQVQLNGVHDSYA